MSDYCVVCSEDIEVGDGQRDWNGLVHLGCKDQNFPKPPLWERAKVAVWNACFDTPLVVMDSWIEEREDGSKIDCRAPRWRWERPDPQATHSGGSHLDKTIYIPPPE